MFTDAEKLYFTIRCPRLFITVQRVMLGYRFDTAQQQRAEKLKARLWALLRGQCAWGEFISALRQPIESSEQARLQSEFNREIELQPAIFQGRLLLQGGVHKQEAKALSAELLVKDIERAITDLQRLGFEEEGLSELKRALQDAKQKHIIALQDQQEAAQELAHFNEIAVKTAELHREIESERQSRGIA